MRGAPRVVENQQSFGLEGDTVQVNCLIKSVPNPSEVVWSRYGVLIDPCKYEYENEIKFTIVVFRNNYI